MKKIIYSLLVITICACNNSTPQTNNKEKDSEEATALFDSITIKLDSLYEEDFFKGIGVSIVNKESVLFNKGFGYADVKNRVKYDEKTIINIASISKVFVGISLLKSEEMGLLKLDDPINKYLPFEVSNPNHPDQEITIRHLATHTSSILDNDNYMKYCYVNKDDVEVNEKLKEEYELYYANPSNQFISLSEFLNRLLEKGNRWYDKSAFSKKKPGEQYEYSNTGTALCALIIEIASKKPFNEFTKEYIFDPLEMNSTGWFYEDVDLKRYSKLYSDDIELPYYRILSYPDGALKTSTTDLSKFLQELIKGSDNEGSLLKDASYDELFKSQLTESQVKHKENFNAGFFTEKYISFNAVGHSGADPGTNTMMFFDSKKKVGRIMILNTGSDKEGSIDMFWKIWNVLAEYEDQLE